MVNIGNYNERKCRGEILESKFRPLDRRLHSRTFTVAFFEMLPVQHTGAEIQAEFQSLNAWKR